MAQSLAKNRIVDVLSTLLDTETMAEVLNQLLCADAEPRLDDREARTAQWLFNRLTEKCPEAVTLATAR